MRDNSLTNSGSQEEWATTEFINSHGATDSNEKLQHVLSGVQSCLGSLVRNTSTLVDNVGVVADQSITRVLRDDTQRDQEHKTVTVTAGSEEIEVATSLLSLVLKSNGILDFLVLELHSLIVLVAVGVVLGKDVEGLFVTLVGHEPTGRFGDPPDEADLDQGWDGLDDGDGSP